MRSAAANEPVTSRIIPVTTGPAMAPRKHVALYNPNALPSTEAGNSSPRIA